MSNVIPFRRNKSNENTTKPAGMVDVFPEENGSGMMLIDGCLPVHVTTAVLALLSAAGVVITSF